MSDTNSDTVKVHLNKSLSTEFVTWENNVKKDIITDLEYRDSLSAMHGIPPPPELDGILMIIEPTPENKDKRGYIRNNSKIRKLLYLIMKTYDS